MISIDYKGWVIFHNYQEGSKEYEEINRYDIWTQDMLDIVGEEFETLEDAKKWVDDQGGY